MDDEKDRLGDKLHELEKAREDQWAHAEDQRLMDKLRQRHTADLHCPHCSSKLAAHAANGVAALACPKGHGGWVDHETLQHLRRR